MQNALRMEGWMPTYVLVSHNGENMKMNKLTLFLIILLLLLIEKENQSIDKKG